MMITSELKIPDITTFFFHENIKIKTCMRGAKDHSSYMSQPMEVLLRKNQAMLTVPSHYNHENSGQRHLGPYLDRLGLSHED